MSLALKSLAAPIARNRLLHATFAALLCVSPALAQKAAAPDAAAAPPKYDSGTEIKTKGVVEEVKFFTLGSRKDFTAVIVKNGDVTVQIYLSPKPYQDEMGIAFAKGDEIAVTGSKIKQIDSEVILAREVVRGTDTLLFRDNKGKPVWDERTGK
jgi:hypothetical protein